jgi:hypothetical protein
MLSEDAILKRLRKIWLRLPRATEGITFGHATFRVEQKMFAAMEEYKGELGICIKVGTLLQGVFLDDPRFFRTPYIGKHGGHLARLYGTARLERNWRARERKLSTRGAGEIP